MYGVTRASRLAKQLEKLCGKPPRNNGRKLWQGLCLLSGDFDNYFNVFNLNFVIFFAQEDEQQGAGAPAHQHHQVNQRRDARLMTIHHSSDHLINVIE